MAMKEKKGDFIDAAKGGEHPADAPLLSEKFGPPSQQYAAPPPQPYAVSPVPTQYYGAPPQQYATPTQQYGGQPPPGGDNGGDKPPPYVAVQPPYGQTSSTFVTTYGSPAILVAQPVREAGPAPTTTCSLVLAILAIFVCLSGWPLAILSIIFNRKAHGQVQLGQYTTARSSLRTAYIFLAVAIVVGIIGWIIFAVRLHFLFNDLD